MTPLCLGGLANGLAVRNAHRHKLRLHLRLLPHAREQRLDGGVTHGRNHGLMRFLVAANAQRRVVLGSLRQKRAHLVLVLLVSSLEGDRVLRRRHGQRVDGNRPRKRQRVAHARVGQLRHHDDVAGLRALHVGGFLAHHHVQVPQAVLLARARVHQLRAGGEHAADDFQVAQAPDEGVGHGLEHERRRLAVLVHVGFLAVCQLEGAVVARMREVRADVLHHAANALLNNGGADVNGYEQLLGDGLIQKLFQLFLRQLLGAVEVLHHQLVVGLGHQVAQTVARNLRGLGVIGRNVLDAVVGGAILIEVARLHAQHVDDALEILGHANGDGDRPQTAAETRVQLRHDGVEVGVLAIDVVDEYRARKAHPLGLAPQLRGHDLRPGHGIDDEERHFSGLHGGQRVADEIGMARRVEQVDLVIMIRNGRDGRPQRELAANFLLVVIEVGLAVMRRPHARGAAGNVQHRLGERRFAGAVLADEHNVSNMFGSRSCHEYHQLPCRVAAESAGRERATTNEPQPMKRKAPAVRVSGTNVRALRCVEAVQRNAASPAQKHAGISVTQRARQDPEQPR